MSSIKRIIRNLIACVDVVFLELLKILSLAIL